QARTFRTEPEYAGHGPARVFRRGIRRRAFRRDRTADPPARLDAGPAADAGDHVPAPTVARVVALAPGASRAGLSAARDTGSSLARAFGGQRRRDGSRPGPRRHRRVAALRRRRSAPADRVEGDR